MTPPIFPTCVASAPVTALLGTNPTRLYPFDDAPQGVASPYAVWQMIPGGSPANNLADRPDMDAFSLQVDVYAASSTDVIAVAAALRDAIEPVATITRWGAQDTDPDTKHKHIGFDVDWYVPR
ncbi:tail completion protein gp17 [Halomonas getboli]|uniref:tail completion protein gp17 n=1 Tax=Halomonas getboli TaxID=2935862 RepID=UPI001FFE6F3A|nr:DUF3168 domain-containing protein [Halomonas getboli]MCK2183506.1 DUF3168 domain-containing protein [Halomonas getboli]